MDDRQAASAAPLVSSSSSKKHSRSRGRAEKAEASAYGLIPSQVFRGRPWTRARDLSEAMVGKHVVLFGNVRSVRLLSNTRALVVLLHWSGTVRCVVTAGSHEGVTTRMVRFAVTLPQQTPIDVEGVVSLPDNGEPLIATAQLVEIQVMKLHSIAAGHADKFRRPCVSITPTPSVKLVEENVKERVGAVRGETEDWTSRLASSLLTLM
ncbi:hypothetical protein BS78_04G007000 [Paspalum vaginatum]|nr:hypothetical protein BS78_04G007000 [Paspalum vaginatum]